MAYDYDFQERMETGRQVAADRRARGLPTGKAAKGWNVKRAPMPDTAENRLYAELEAMRGELRTAQNELQRHELGMVDQIDDFGAEFDRLAGRGLASAPHVTESRTQARKDARGNAMTKKQYLDALKKLGLTPAGKDTAQALGLSLRQCQRFAAGTPVPGPVAKLIAMYLEHGIPDGD